ncbi:MAG: response regulator [Magnetococcus sp. DMHC-1]|nr:response regulator [Magnetococcales bacterium]
MTTLKHETVRVTFPEGTRVLVVEDETINRQVAKAMLRNLGIVADEAENGQEALTLMQNNHYDLVLMDCQMPCMDGFDATREYRILESRRSTYLPLPIIALTSHSTQKNRELCLAAGMDDCLIKPVNMRDFTNKLLLWLGLQSSMPATGPVSDHLSSDPAQPVDLQRLSELQQALRNAPGGFARLLDQFIRGMEFQLAEIHTALPAAEFDLAQRRTHNLKSQSAIFGAMVLSGLLKQLDIQIRAQALSKSMELLDLVQLEFSRVKPILEKAHLSQ